MIICMFDEVFTKNKPRVAYRDIISWANSLPYNTLIKKKNEAENLFKKSVLHSLFIIILIALRD